MEKAQLALTATRIDQRNFGPWLKNWQIGQTLNALVTARGSTGELLLRIAGQQLTATAEVSVQPGTHLLLEVKQLRPVPLLRILSTSPAAVVPREASAALREASREAGATLAAVGRQVTALPGGALSPALQAALQRLLRLPPGAGALGTVGGLRAAVLASGTFAEARLRAAADGGAPASTPDLKLQLQRVLSLLGQSASAAGGPHGEALASLRGELEGLLGGIQLNQLASLPPETGGTRSWQINLPFVIAGELMDSRLLIFEEPRKGGDTEGNGAAWRAELSLDLPGLGALVARIRLKGNGVQVDFEVAGSTARAVLGARLAELGAGLESRGLAVDGLQLQQQAPAAAVPAAPASPEGWQA